MSPLGSRPASEVITLAREYAAWANTNRLVEDEEMPPPPSVSKIDLARVLVESNDKHERLLTVLRDLAHMTDGPLAREILKLIGDR
jgi:hypothetical protein